MSCCGPGADYALYKSSDENAASEFRLASRAVREGIRQTDLSVPGIHCGGCIQRIERALNALPGVDLARVNLSTKRVAVQWNEDSPPPPVVAALANVGYQANLDDASDDADGTQRKLFLALAVAGFSASNIMLLSVSVWSGAEPSTRDLFHWLSAILAIGTLMYSGRIFFNSAWKALKHGGTNMDVPISIGVLLAYGLSLYETVHQGQHAYFDAAVSLLFFLLIGRTLDHAMRERARTAVKGLARLASRGALTVQADGQRLYLPVDEIGPGMTILLAAGERVPVDARIISGRSELDTSLLNGESVPQEATEGALLKAGTLNLTAPLTIRATAAARDSFLADIIRLMEAAERGRAGYRRIADRAAGLYAPVVHTAAAVTLIGWLIATGDLHRSITIAIAVLIITCPCALGLAVPMVQIVAARRLFENGLLLKDGGALERLAEIDLLVFDKTGTLTLGAPRLIPNDTTAPTDLQRAAAMAEHSRHPYSRALTAAVIVDPVFSIPSNAISESPGHGLEARLAGGLFRLGRPSWALAADGVRSDTSSLVLTRDGQLVAAFEFEDRPREGMGAAIAELRRAGFPMEILSGDSDSAVRSIAEPLRLKFAANVTPAGKARRIEELQSQGRKVLMVGDGLNDAPALMACHASIAPASAADIGRNAADLVFLHESLIAVPRAIRIARDASVLVRQNLALAVIYNVIAVPIAVLGYVTPLLAAIAMSLSSILVVANAMRLRKAPFTLFGTATNSGAWAGFSSEQQRASS